MAKAAGNGYSPPPTAAAPRFYSTFAESDIIGGNDLAGISSFWLTFSSPISCARLLISSEITHYHSLK